VDALIEVENLPTAGRNTSALTRRVGNVEPMLVWPLVKGQQVGRWSLEYENLYCLVPHQPSDLGKVISVSEMMRSWPEMHDYLEPWIPLFNSRRLYRDANASGPWGLSGPFQHLDAMSPVVLVRYISSGGRPAAAVALPRYDAKLNRVTIPLPNNKLNIYFTETEDEAFYLAAWVNSSSVQDLLSRFAASTGITPRALQNIPIPKYEQTNLHHVEISECGREAHARVEAGRQDLADLEDRIDELVMLTAITD